MTCELTKKRFIPSIDESCIIDNLKNKGLYSVIDTVECLNHLHEENQQLRKENKALKDANDGLAGTIAHFELEDLE